MSTATKGRAPAPSLAQGLSGSTMKRWAGSRKTETEQQDAANARREAKKKPSEMNHDELMEATKSFPNPIKFEGKTFYKSGKVGYNFKSGLPSCEYKGVIEGRDDRVWRDSAGTVKED